MKNFIKKVLCVFGALIIAFAAIPISTFEVQGATYPSAIFFSDSSFETVTVSQEIEKGPNTAIYMKWMHSYKHEKYKLELLDSNKQVVATLESDSTYCDTYSTNNTINWDTSNYNPGTYTVVVHFYYYSFQNWHESPTTSKLYVTLKEHSWDKGIVTKEQTDKEDGIITYTCTTCGTQKTEAIKKYGWTDTGHGICYQNKDGSRPENQWLFIDNQWYYFGSSGYLYTGWLVDEGKEYYLNNGVKLTGWNYVLGHWYYMDTNGVMVKTQWVGNYYLQSNGQMAYSCYVKSANSNLYYWVNADGSYAPKWNTTQPDLEKYRLAVSFKNVGWNYLQGNWYYMDTNGIILSSQWIGNYYLQTNGIMARNCYVKSKNSGVYYWVNNDGSYVPGWDTTQPDLYKYDVAR